MRNRIGHGLNGIWPHRDRSEPRATRSVLSVTSARETVSNQESGGDRRPCFGRQAGRYPMTAFMIVPALVATMPPIMAPATIFGDCEPPPVHFSQAKWPPA
ncbi:hypothetical protein NRB20_00970 [Nocardia sp. RB20]|uniref:Uncharacterized protein n=1 Tax=Nocardia macrotermitis TaxID=2585198 RepID=A0A7K0CWK3_9NOCA|nr:hypothetical protein [Nocardia macrotermitis]